MSFVYDTILKRRSIRRFTSQEIPEDLIYRMIDAARLAPSAANLQPMCYIAVKSPEVCDRIFQNTMWAGYVKPNGAPTFEKRPRLFVAALFDSRIKENVYEIDAGLAIENMILTAEAEGVSSCIIAACNKNEISKILNIPGYFTLECVIGFGYPAHQSDYYDDPNGNVKYTMDEGENFHVPKRPLSSIMTII